MAAWSLIEACRGRCTRMPSQQCLRRCVSRNPNRTNILSTSNHREQEFRPVTAVGSVTRKADRGPRHARWSHPILIIPGQSTPHVNDLSATIPCEPAIACDLKRRTSRGQIDPSGLRFPFGTHRDASWAARRGWRERARCGARVMMSLRVCSRSILTRCRTARCSMRHWFQCRGRAVWPLRPDGVHPRRGSLSPAGCARAISCAVRGAGPLRWRSGRVVEDSCRITVVQFCPGWRGYLRRRW
jgi:hypothetical protein